MSPVQKSLLSKLIVSFSVLSLATITVVANAAYYQGKQAIEKSVSQQLSATESIHNQKPEQNLTTQEQKLLLSSQLSRALATNIFLISLGSCALSWLGIYWLSRRITSPILSLTEAATQLTNGNLNELVTVSSQDELGILADSLNNLTQQLRDSAENLDLQVEQKTAQLNQLLSQQQIAKEQLQQRVQQLQEQLRSVDRGDLTIRATVTNDELGSLAKSYNSMIENLEAIVAQVKIATQTVFQTTNRNEEAISKLATGVSFQKEEFSAVLGRIETMVSSMETLANQAVKAEITIKQANEKVKQGDLAINETVERILALGETTSATKEQVKRLGRASRKISKAVELIRKIALQTNVLAVNASIEAARAGEEGLGFTVVADEVQSLAAQSAQTATDIEALVLEIQTETDKVVRAMEESSKEVLAGSQLMKQTRSSLQELSITSEEVNQLVEAIAIATREQSQTSQTVTKTIQQVAAIVYDTSASATDVSSSFQELLSVSQQLQNSVDKFKVN